jgi:hypothetical protein
MSWLLSGIEVKHIDSHRHPLPYQQAFIQNPHVLLNMLTPEPAHQTPTLLCSYYTKESTIRYTSCPAYCHLFVFHSAVQSVFYILTRSRYNRGGSPSLNLYIRQMNNLSAMFPVFPMLHHEKDVVIVWN